jgi:DNA-binding response OmpR family regulator
MAGILVIDDDRAVLSTIRILLERDAHTVEAVDNSRAGLHLLETRKFDILIVDIFMPGMDGFETMSLARRSWPEMPMIVMSGHQFRSASEREPDFLYMATKLGAAIGLQKPFKPRDLLAAVTSCLSEQPTSSGATKATQGDLLPD